MKRVLLVWALGSALAGLGAQPSATSLLWGTVPAIAEETARSQAKPVLLLWQAGPTAALFTQGVEQLFSAWPGWSAQVATLTVSSRARSWEGSLPSTFPALPDPKAPALMLWSPGSAVPAVIWTQVPPVLDLARTVARMSQRPLPDPYTVDVVAYEWDDGALTRADQGPLWKGQGDGDSSWVEEGPLGTVLVLRETATGRRAAFPLEGDWSFVFDPVTQSWSPWKPVLVKRR